MRNRTLDGLRVASALVVLGTVLAILGLPAGDEVTPRNPTPTGYLLLAGVYAVPPLLATLDVSVTWRRGLTAVRGIRGVLAALVFGLLAWCLLVYSRSPGILAYDPSGGYDVFLGPVFLLFTAAVLAVLVLASTAPTALGHERKTEF